MTTRPLNLIEPDSLLVVSSLAPLLAQPQISSGLASQLLYGEKLELVQSDGDWRRVRDTGGYEGWTHIGYCSAIRKIDAQPHADRMSLGCWIKQRDAELELPFGAFLLRGDEIISGTAEPLMQLQESFPSTGEAVAHSASLWFVGTPYLWGGVTPWGADCSGFVRSIYRLHGLELPRDSAAQLERADTSMPDADPAAAQPGDLLFFSDRPDGRITHVGISLAGSRMAHVALGRGGFAVEDFAPDNNDSYVQQLRERFRALVPFDRLRPS